MNRAASNPAIQGKHRARSSSISFQRGFSLIELLIVICITGALTAMLLPGLQMAREGARRLICASNERQIGVGLALFAKDENERMPDSWFQDENRYADMMALSSGQQRSNIDPRYIHEPQFEGIGYLLPMAGGYCDSASCFYCPSHRGEHTLEKYQGQFHAQTRTPVYANYHYTGDKIHQENKPFRRFFGGTSDQVLLTDGLRTLSDYSHSNGMNVLRGDVSVEWKADTAGQITEMLPMSAPESGMQWHNHIQMIWDTLEFNN